VHGVYVCVCGVCARACIVCVKDLVDRRDFKRNGYADKVLKTYNKLKKLSK